MTAEDIYGYSVSETEDLLDLVEDLEIRGAWFGAEAFIVHNDQMSMLVDEELLESDKELYEVVEWFKKDFLPSNGLRFDDFYYSGVLVVFFS